MPAEMAVVHRKNPQQGRQASENEYLADDEPLLLHIGPLLTRHLRILPFAAIRFKSGQLAKAGDYTQNPAPGSMSEMAMFQQLRIR